jgi:bifunctional polynucleotide phosphatase/kinase
MTLVLGTLPQTVTNWALFDLDWTIIYPVKGTLFKPGVPYRWLPNRKETLLKLSQMGYRIGIVTNQKVYPQNPLTQVQSRLGSVFQELSSFIPEPLILVSTGENQFRKPDIGWKQYLMLSDKSWYCGDAAGRPDDFSDSDRKFAENLGITFYLPEQIFPNSNIPPQFYTLTPIIALFVGAPGSGKSTAAAQLSQQGWTVVSSDNYRSNRTAIANEIRRLVSLHTPKIVVDGTNGTRSGRHEYLSLAPNYYKVIIHFLNSGEERNKLRPNPIPKIAYNMYWSRFEEPDISDQVPVYQLI